MLRYVRELAHPVGAVWTAITDPQQMSRWWGARPEIELRVDGAYVSHHATGDRVVDRIVRLEPPRLLEHTFWAHLNPDALVTYELEPTKEGCRLVLTHRLTTGHLQNAAQATAWPRSLDELLDRTRAGWPRLLDALEASLSAG